MNNPNKLTKIISYTFLSCIFTVGFVSLYLFLGLPATITLLCLVILYVFFGTTVKYRLKEKTKDMDDYTLGSFGYTAVIILGLFISGLALVFDKNSLSNNGFMVAVFALGILTANAIMIALLKAFLEDSEKPSKSRGAQQTEKPKKQPPIVEAFLHGLNQLPEHELGEVEKKVLAQIDEMQKKRKANKSKPGPLPKGEWPRRVKEAFKRTKEAGRPLPD